MGDEASDGEPGAARGRRTLSAVEEECSLPPQLMGLLSWCAETGDAIKTIQRSLRQDLLSLRDDQVVPIASEMQILREELRGSIVRVAALEQDLQCAQDLRAELSIQVSSVKDQMKTMQEQVDSVSTTCHVSVRECKKAVADFEARAHQVEGIAKQVSKVATARQATARSEAHERDLVTEIQSLAREQKKSQEDMERTRRQLSAMHKEVQQLTNPPKKEDKQPTPQSPRESAEFRQMKIQLEKRFQDKLTKLATEAKHTDDNRLIRLAEVERTVSTLVQRHTGGSADAQDLKSKPDRLEVMSQRIATNASCLRDLEKQVHQLQTNFAMTATAPRSPNRPDRFAEDTNSVTASSLGFGDRPSADVVQASMEMRSRSSAISRSSVGSRFSRPTARPESAR